jgi:hypothetical protein
VSLTFWFKCSPVSKVSFPITEVQKVALRRNIETQLSRIVGGPKGVRVCLCVSVCLSVCVCVRACVRARARAGVCMCVFACFYDMRTCA